MVVLGLSFDRRETSLNAYVVLGPPNPEMLVTRGRACQLKGSTSLDGIRWSEPGGIPRLVAAHRT